MLLPLLLPAAFLLGCAVTMAAYRWAARDPCRRCGQMKAYYEARCPFCEGA